MKTHYQKTLDQIFSRTAFGISPGLERMQKACEILDHPERKFKSIQIAGTNGKGSTAAMLTQILIESGYKVGLTVSPHLDDYRERMQINRELISPEKLIEIHEDLEKKLLDIPLTFYEWTVLLAFSYFAKEEVEIAVLETGMGGRWDAVSVVKPIVSAITNISLDHQEYLGETLEDILEEKIQIIKSQAKVWSGIDQKNLKERLIEFCLEKNAQINFIDDLNLEISLPGDFQKKNAALAVGISKSLMELDYQINDDSIKQGLKNTKWAGRLEEIFPRFWLDACHNMAGIYEMIEFIKSKPQLKFKIYFSCLKNRPIQKMLKKIFPYVEEVILVSFDYFQSFTNHELSEIQNHLNHEKIKRVISIDHLNSNQTELCSDEGVIICGSIYFLGEIRKKL